MFLNVTHLKYLKGNEEIWTKTLLWIDPVFFNLKFSFLVLQDEILPKKSRKTGLNSWLKVFVSSITCNCDRSKKMSDQNMISTLLYLGRRPHSKNSTQLKKISLGFILAITTALWYLLLVLSRQKWDKLYSELFLTFQGGRKLFPVIHSFFS